MLQGDKKKLDERWACTLKEFRENPEDKQTRDTLFFMIQDCCRNLGKQKCVGIRVDSLEEKVLDATINVFNRIVKGVNPESLVSYCYWFVVGTLWDKKTAFWDRVSYIDDLTEENVCIGSY